MNELNMYRIVLKDASITLTLSFHIRLIQASVFQEDLESENSISQF